MAEKETIKDLDNIKPIDHGTIAKPHTPVYKMHRYFARRPYSVFSELIKHYSNPGSIILDPFCGGGVTVVEGLRLKRKVIGVDINPMATFITRMEVMDVDLEELQKAFEEIEAKVKDEILELYMTKCPKCGKDTPADWFEWSNRVLCPDCNRKIVVSECKKGQQGYYICNKCNKRFAVSNSKKIDEVLIRLKITCNHCNYKSAKDKSTDLDLKKVKNIEQNFERIIAERKLWFPNDPLPESNLERENSLHEKGFLHYSDFFTKRSLLATALLFKALRDNTERTPNEFLNFVFTSCLFEVAPRLCHLKNNTVVKPGHHFWPPEVFAENNVWRHFSNRMRSALKAKKYSSTNINKNVEFSSDYDELKNSKDCLLMTNSSDKLPLPDESLDTIITDPPYGGNVNYIELSNFWAVWIKDILGLKGLIEREKEAIVDRHLDFKGAKTLKDYRVLMCEIFKECFRLLRKRRWMVLTFHNREFKVWNSVHLAAHDAGFIMPEEDGMIYQLPIQAYTTTLHQKRGGTMIGDFILSFQKAEKQPEKKMIPYMEIEKRIQELAAEATLHHHGASLSTIYMKIMPFLLNNNLLEKIHENDLPPYLRDSFEERDGKWYLKENIGDPLRDYLSDYSKSHYKEDYRVLDFIPVEARLEYLIRRLLYKNGYATQDEILNEIYSNLINSNAAEYGEINRVLSKIAKLVPGPKDKRKVWRLNEDIERQERLEFIEGKIKEEVTISEESEHDLVIRRLVDLGAKEGYASHIGRTEQKKYVEFRKLSLPMANNVQYGMDKRGFEIVTEIDVLWLKGDTIVTAFEVEKTTTIDSGINRFRNLFAVQPNTTIETYIVVPNKRKKEAEKKLSSPANVKNGLTKKIGYILFDDLDIKGNIEKIDFSKIKRKAE